MDETELKRKHNLNHHKTAMKTFFLPRKRGIFLAALIWILVYDYELSYHWASSYKYSKKRQRQRDISDSISEIKELGFSLFFSLLNFSFLLSRIQINGDFIRKQERLYLVGDNSIQRFNFSLNFFVFIYLLISFMQSSHFLNTSCLISSMGD